MFLSCLIFFNFYSVSTIKKKCNKEGAKERQRELAKVGLSNEEETDEGHGGLSVRLVARKKRREKLAEVRKRRAEIVR